MAKSTQNRVRTSKAVQIRTSKTSRKATSGAHVSRGTITKNGKVIGTASDGTVIFEPKLKPKTFSKTVLRKVVKDVKSKRRDEHAMQAS